MIPEPRSQPLVSVCMPAYNVERVLGAALDSVLTQTYPRIEIVLVDDGSPDGTARVARQAGGERIRYFRNQTQLGGYQTMNRAISLAQGEYIAVYHSDDIYDSTIVEKEAAYLQSHPQAGAVFCMDHFMDGATGKVFGGLPCRRNLPGSQPLRMR